MAQLLFDKGNDELCNIDNWLVANKLSLNANKTKRAYFKTADSKTPPSDLNLVIRNIPIERVSSVRVLLSGMPTAVVIASLAAYDATSTPIYDVQCPPLL